MKIIILGAGQVGGTLAENLASEANDITVVDLDAGLLGDLQDRLDIRTVQGYPSFPDVLRRAGADDADMIIAVTESDETNMIACQIAYTLFHTPTKIARVRSGEYLSEESLFRQDAIPVDMRISPAQLVTDYIRRLIEYPGALQVVDFADGRVRMVGVKAYYGGPLVGQQLRELPNHLPGADARLNHYFTKSRSEYRKKRWRGRADKPKSWYADLRNESLWSARVDLRLVEQLALRYQHSRGREEKMLLHSLMQSLRNRSALPERAAAMLSAHCIATKSVACTWLGVGHAES